MAGPGCTCIATDSMAFKERAQSIKDRIARGERWKKKYELKKDGDLWKMVWAFIEAKGPDNIAYIKVKGHVTDKMVNNGIVDIDEKKGNDKADEAAEEGGRIGRDDEANFMSRWCKRVKDYRKL
eukprot:7052483-Karenia_brevis.AAC.1